MPRKHKGKVCTICKTPFLPTSTRQYMCKLCGRAKRTKRDLSRWDDFTEQTKTQWDVDDVSWA